MGKKRSTVAFVLMLVCCAMGCGHLDPSLSRASGAVGISSAQRREDQNFLDIKSVEFFAHKGLGLKKNYAKITQLAVDARSRLTIPEKFDIIAVIDNKGRSPIQYGDFILLTTLEFVVAPNAPLNDADKIIKEYSWSRDGLVDDVKLVLVPFVEPGKPSRIEFRGFNLSKTNKALSDSDMIERVWAIKATVHILDRKMVEILRRDTVITVQK